MASYKSFCWSMGTTSFRMKEFNYKIERQLQLLARFREKCVEAWSANDNLQTAYYDFLKKEKFIEGMAPNKPKDARQKTSGLVDIGLVDDQRYLTEVGEKLLQISREQSFGGDNILQIPQDSYLYLRQLLKTYTPIDDEVVRPFVVTVLAILELGYLTNEEFEYLMPLCTSEKSYKAVIKNIRLCRKGQMDIDMVIEKHLLAMANYQEALTDFMRRGVSEASILAAGMNRKSRSYDKPYWTLYKALTAVRRHLTGNSAVALFEACGGINGRSGVLWKKLLFDTTSKEKVRKDPQGNLNAEFLGLKDTDFQKWFFRRMHVYKAKATLGDYFDLNRRYFGIADTFTFENGQVELDILPKAYFELAKDGLWRIAFETCATLPRDIELSEIIPDAPTQAALMASLKRTYKDIKDGDAEAIKQFVKNKQLDRFKQLIKNKFPQKVLLQLLTDFEERNDTQIQSVVTANADIPTIFEYMVAIIWYQVNGFEGNILESMHLSLDADLLPKTHAGGGTEDIAFAYTKTKAYPAHTLLLEVTLSEENSQRRMEMEPVSRHLGDHLLRSGNMDDYAVFVSTFLNPNVIGDFRGRAKKDHPYYDPKNPDRFVAGMKIIPLETKDLKNILTGNLRYGNLYGIFDRAFTKEDMPYEWYKKHIKGEIEKGVRLCG